MRPALAERALERRLLAQRLVGSAARGAVLGERADAATRDPREADGRAEIHQRLGVVGRERVPRSLLYPADVRVARKDVLAEGEVAHCCRGVLADAWKRREVVGPAALRDDASRAVEVERAAVVAEPLPFA